jgi:hypothetical protein
MPAFRVALVVVCLAASSLFAQTLPPVPEPPPLADVPVQQPQGPPQPGDEPVAGSPSPGDPLQDGGGTDLGSGVNGELLTDTASAPATGVLLGAFASTPDIFARLGTITSASSFNVVGSDNVPLFRVRGDGAAYLRKDQTFTTVFDLNNANPGSSSVVGGTALRFLEGTTERGGLSAVGSAASSQAGGAGALQLWNTGQGATVFMTSGLERMRVNQTPGYVTIGYAGNYADARFLVQHGVTNSTGLFVTHQPTVLASGDPQDTGIYSQVTQDVRAGATNSGRLIGARFRSILAGPGTLASSIGALVEIGTDKVSYPTGISGAVLASAIGVRIDSYLAANTTVTNGYGMYVQDILATNDYGVYQAAANDTNYFAGNVIIGGTVGSVLPEHANKALNVQGDANFSGNVTGTNIQARFQDVAEWVPSNEDLAGGTVVILDPAVGNGVTASHSAYDTTVAGVISDQPGIILGVGAADKEKVATTGRVKVKVDATAAPIRIGDLLVTSDIAGTAMKSTPLSLGGVSIHRPGTIIGKALESLDSGTGEILVLLSLQ